MLTNEDLQAISGLITSAVTASEGRMMARMDKIDARLANMDARLDNMDTRLDNMDARLDNMDARLGRVEHELVEVKDRLCAGTSQWWNRDRYDRRSHPKNRITRPKSRYDRRSYLLFLI